MKTIEELGKEYKEAVYGKQGNISYSTSSSNEVIELKNRVYALELQVKNLLFIIEEDEKCIEKLTK
jgi:chaperonin cofactor prefoldin